MPLVFAPHMLEPFGVAVFSELRTRPQLDVDRLADADGEAGEPDDHEADYEQHGARGGIREFALNADELANPAAGTRHAVEEQQNASHDAGEPEDQPGTRIDQVQRRQP